MFVVFGDSSQLVFRESPLGLIVVFETTQIPGIVCLCTTTVFICGWNLILSDHMRSQCGHTRWAVYYPLTSVAYPNFSCRNLQIMIFVDILLHISTTLPCSKHCTSINTRCIDLSGIHASSLHVWAPPLTEVLHYSAFNAVTWSNYALE